jgi:hypothetical protein
MKHHFKTTEKYQKINIRYYRSIICYLENIGDGVGYYRAIIDNNTKHD